MELKFRAWHKPTQLMDDVVLIDFYNEKIGILYADPVMQCESIQKYNFNEVELMQYTGLKDKNGVEIYEGDILYILQTGVISNGLEAHDENRRVLFYDGSFCIENYAKTEKLDIENHYEIGLYHTPDELEVIGNIFENPELVEEQTEMKEVE